ncbi:hypothetical protein FOA52_009618 [Chlamydomonas sp. UWO 241]|nr:hypothetical protein FOA52_009618 [Chlamydomonas sp. UWO 241]
MWDPQEQRKRHVGSYASEEDAARAYDCAAVKLLGPGAERNFPTEIISELPVSQSDKKKALKTSRFEGVTLVKTTGKWLSRRLRDLRTKKVKTVGTFASKVEAAWKHDVEWLKLDPGVSDMKLNFPIQVRANPSDMPPQGLLVGEAAPEPEPEQP